MTQYLGKNRSEAVIKAEQGILTGEFGLLPIQQWFVDKMHSGELAKPDHWNQRFLIKVHALDKGKLENIVKELVLQHDVLRIRYVKENDEITGEARWKQIYRLQVSVPELRELDISSHTTAEVQDILTAWQGNFDLERGPLFCMGYLYGYEDGSARIYFSLHHMITDAFSRGILAEQVKSLYEGSALPPKGSSYRQWVASVEQYRDAHPLEAAYWKEQLEDMPRYSIQGQDEQISQYNFKLDRELTRSLLQKASNAYHTEINDLILTALVYALLEFNNEDSQGIVLQGHGREDVDPEIDHSHTVGWFTTMFPVKLEIMDSFKDSIRSIKETLRRIPNKGIGFGAFATSQETPYKHQDLPHISFNYLGQFDTQQGADWEIMAEDSGMNMHHSNKACNVININGMVSNGILEFSVATMLGKNTTEQLGADLSNYLRKIIVHCEEKLKDKGSSHTPGDFKFLRISQKLLDRLEDAAKLKQNEIAHIYRANSLQQGFIYHAVSQREDDAYHVQFLYDYHMKLEIGKYIQAWEYCIAQFPILRTAFNYEEDIIQVIYKKGELTWQEHDISHLSTQQDRDLAIESIRANDKKRRFDLSTPTLLRLHVIRQAEDYYTVINSQHHITSDGWSDAILLRKLHQYYFDLIDNRSFIAEEDIAYLKAQEYITNYKSAIQNYWNDALSPVEAANDINPLLSRPVNLSSYKHVDQPQVRSLEIGGEMYQELKKISQKETITVDVMVQFVWHKLLQCYSNQMQTVVGTTVSGRGLPIEGIEESLGLYINTLPLVIDWDNDNTVRVQLHEIQEKLAALSAHSFADLAKLQKNGERVFHSLLVYENYPVPKSGREVHGISKITLRAAVEKIDYPFGIIAYERNDALTINLHYDGKYLTEEKAARHIATLEHIMHQVIDNPGQLHAQLSLLRPEEYKKIIYDWNTTDKTYPDNKTLIDLFEEQVAKTPDNIAVVFEDCQLTYRELNEKSNRLARYVGSQYTKRTKSALLPDTLIAICLDRSLEMVIGILAVLKSGAGYLPIDLGYPQERIDYILRDSGSEIILSQRQIIEAGNVVLPEDKVLFIDLSEGLYENGPDTNPGSQISPKDLVYVLYTSGTTGNPKGVMMDHFSVSIRILYMIDRSNITASDFHLFKTNYVFDVSVTDIFTHLCAGAKFQITRHSFDVDELNGLLYTYRFTSIHIVPSQYELISSAVNSCGLSKVYFSGEAITPEILSTINRNINILNYYGPTETGDITVFAPSAPNEGHVIGKIFPNSLYYVLDRKRNPVPAGVIGELYIGGAGLSRGYLNRPDLTRERYVKNPFATASDKSAAESDMSKEDTYLYKTGDLVRWLPDGNLEYSGRNDDQVKIRGYRIEPGEIEHALLQIGGIKQAYVLAKERKTESGRFKYLVGYYVPDNRDSAITPTTITNELLGVLPEYMMPAALVSMDLFPLTINGKMDKRALPDPELSAAANKYVEPATEIEKSICRIWQDVLGTDQVGITDNFFSIGGNSIVAIQVSQRVSKVLGYDVKVDDVFRYPTICQFLSGFAGFEKAASCK